VGPDLRFGHTMTTLGGQIVVFGGTDAAAAFPWYDPFA
jgi:hypothetical protein